MSDWTICYDQWSPDDQLRREALCCVGNGYFVTRGSDESQRPHAHDCHYPGTYLAGGYNRATTHIAGRVMENEDLVNFPNWLFLTYRTDCGSWFDIDSVELIEFEQRLELKEGVLVRRMRYRDGQGRTSTLVSRRLVSMRDQHLAAIEWELTPEDWEGEVEFRSEIDGRVHNSGVPRYRDLNGDHFAVTGTAREDDQSVSLTAETHQSRLRVSLCARLRIDGATAKERQYVDQGDRAGEEVTVHLSRGEPVRIEKVVSIFTSRDSAISEPRLEAFKAVQRAGSFEDLLDRHRLAWARLWDRFDLTIRDPEHLSLLRLHIFHLLQVASPLACDLDVGVPARGWHGEAYRGHILWDELFIFPLLNLRMPDLTRSLLLYRYRRLGEARAVASNEGRRGARFPWQSGSNGREESQVVHLNPQSGEWGPDHSQLQRHINLAIAYNVWHYYQCTGDCEFLASYGAELMIEAARDLADRAELEKDGRYHIRGVMGPDEFHEAYPDAEKPGIDDNAYTNLMTSWLLSRIREVLSELPKRRYRELSHDLGLSDDEVSSWNEVSERLYLPITEDGIISQFAGFTELEEFPWDKYRKRYDDLQRLDRILESEGKSPNAYQVTKQADVLMLFFLFSAEEIQQQFEHLGYDYSAEMIPRNVEYYLARTSHGSTLSRIVHAWVMARGDREGSWELFEEALRSDIDDIQGGTTSEGIHLGAMAGTVDLVHRCYAGIHVRDGVLHLHPVLPEQLSDLRLRVHFRGARLDIRVTHEEVELETGDRWLGETPIAVRDERVKLDPGKSCRIPLNAAESTRS